MASGIYTATRLALWKGEIDTDIHTFKIALLNNSHSFNPDHDNWSDVSSNQITGTGYTAGGKDLASFTQIVDDTNNLLRIDADNPSWTSASFTAYHAVIYNDSHANDRLICSIDFGGAQTVSSGTFTINFHSDGIFTEANA